MEMLQHVTVTVVALGAAVVLVRRVLGFIGPDSSRKSACGSCPSSTPSCDASAKAGGSPAVTHPAVLIGVRQNRERPHLG